MKATTSHEAPRSLRTALADDHERLDRLFEHLLDALGADAREDGNQLWTEFDAALSQHMAVEEEYLFPALSKAHSQEVIDLKLEHDRIRTLLAELGVGVDLHLARTETVRAFIEYLRAHARRENELIYRLADTELEGTARNHLRERLQLLVAAVRNPPKREPVE